MPLQKFLTFYVGGAMSESNERNPMQILYVILSLLFAIFCALIKYKGYSVGLFARAGIFILCFIGSYIGALIGDFLRRLALPDSFFTSGDMIDILKTKLFWAIGPQVVGIFIGGIVGTSIILSFCK